MQNHLVARDASTPSTNDLVNQARPAISAVLRRLMGADDPDYEDIVQNSLEHVFVTVNAGRYRKECPLAGWAAVIARNIAITEIRARGRARKVFVSNGHDEALQMSGSAAMSPEHLTDIHRRLDRVEAALSRLNHRKATVVYMHDVLGYGLVDVAARIGTSITAAQSRLVRGRRELLGTLAETSPTTAQDGRARPPKPRPALKSKDPTLRKSPARRC